MDIMTITGIYFFNTKVASFRIILVFLLFYPMRAVVQNTFLINRLKGWMWFNPGVPSLTIPYHNTNDFFYSGHLGSITIWTLEFISQGNKVMTVYTCLLGTFMWVFLTTMRVHYVIDLITGIIVAHWCFM